LARSARRSSNFYSCLAGFIEIGETPEQTVLREVEEEVGIKVRNIRYIKSQPWPFPSQLMIGFRAEYDSGELVLDTEEIADARWFSAKDFPPIPSARISVAGELIEDFVNDVKSGKL
ncbi:MAG: NAD(+) diphosphatase, partial [Gimesia chilikensis]